MDYLVELTFTGIINAPDDWPEDQIELNLKADYAHFLEDAQCDVTLTLALDSGRLKELVEKEKILIRLEGAGVDNWEGYDIAMEGYYVDP